MKKAFGEYQRLAKSFLGFSSLWQGGDHLLYIKGSGWVVQSLEAALWAFNRANSFKEAVLTAVNLGDDSDTTGAITGQLAGAYWGEHEIESELLDGLARKDLIERALASLGCSLSR